MWLYRDTPSSDFGETITITPNTMFQIIDTKTDKVLKKGYQDNLKDYRMSLVRQSMSKKKQGFGKTGKYVEGMDTPSSKELKRYKIEVSSRNTRSNTLAIARKIIATQTRNGQKIRPEAIPTLLMLIVRIVQTHQKKSQL